MTQIIARHLVLLACFVPFAAMAAPAPVPFRCPSTDIEEYFDAVARDQALLKTFMISPLKYTFIEMGQIRVARTVYLTRKEITQPVMVAPSERAYRGVRIEVKKFKPKDQRRVVTEHRSREGLRSVYTFSRGMRCWMLESLSEAPASYVDTDR